MYREETFASLASGLQPAFVYMHRLSSSVRVVLFLLAISTGPVALAADGKQVLLLHSFGTEMRPWSDYARGIREELNRQSPWPLTITDQSVISARYSNSKLEKPFVEYLAALFAEQTPDVIVSVGAPAAAFVQRNRGQLFLSTPIVLTTLESRRIQYSSLTRNDVVVPIQIDYKAVIANILKVLPDTRHIAVVNGTSPNEKFWSNLIHEEAARLSHHVEFIFWDSLSFDDISKEAARLPPHSAIIWEGMSVDAAGVVHDGNDAFKTLHAVANAPIFGYTEPLIGQGIVGGPFNAVYDTSRTAAAVVVRILGGETPSDIRVPPLPFSTPRFDWREIKRWGISESRLPLGSEIVFRDRTAWQQYRWQIAMISTVVLLQAVLICVLLFERRRRQVAEVQARQRSAELAHINRYSMAGELTTTIAHELNQPLGAILTNAEAAEVLIKSTSPDLDEVAEILADIRRDDQRANDVIGRLRSLLRREPLEFKRIDFNDVARDTLQFLAALAIARKADLANLIGLTPLPIRGDVVQLQQVILNLIVNAMDAMSDVSIADRRITISSARDGNAAEVSVSDLGPGIPKEKLKDVFEPFFTTKPHGMGMGLSIARTIVEAHGGRLFAENSAKGGVTFYVRIPLAE
ncbi:sensor histidine kinase [Bradyrhizobium jicamae]|nr:sensor histidine kinase [Bradyrhizobium jicamae]